MSATNNATATQRDNTLCGWTTSQINEALPKGAKARIARRANVHRGSVSHVIAGRVRSRRLEGMVAQTIGVPREVIFPVRIEQPTPAVAPEGVQQA